MSEVLNNILTALQLGVEVTLDYSHVVPKHVIRIVPNHDGTYELIAPVGRETKTLEQIHSLLCDLPL